MESLLLLLHFSIIIPLEIVKILLWEGLKSGVSLKALIFFIFFMEADADLFFQSEINCYCKWFVLSCTERCQGREESVRSRVWRLTTVVLWICPAFRECLHWDLTVVLDSLPSLGASVRAALQLSHFQLFSPGHHLTFSATSVGKAELSLRVADMEHLYYGWWWGGCCSDIVMLQVLTNEFLQCCCSNSRCYLLPAPLTLIAKNLSPAVRKLAGENLGSHLSCSSAHSASLCQWSSRIWTQVLSIEKLKCVCSCVGSFWERRSEETLVIS